jgi:hypothetical protein
LFFIHSELSHHTQIFNSVHDKIGVGEEDGNMMDEDKKTITIDLAVRTTVTSEITEVRTEKEMITEGKINIHDIKDRSVCYLIRAIYLTDFK